MKKETQKFSMKIFVTALLLSTLMLTMSLQRQKGPLHASEQDTSMLTETILSYYDNMFDHVVRLDPLYDYVYLDTNYIQIRNILNELNTDINYHLAELHLLGSTALFEEIEYDIKFNTVSFVDTNDAVVEFTISVMNNDEQIVSPTFFIPGSNTLRLHDLNGSWKMYSWSISSDNTFPNVPSDTVEHSLISVDEIKDWYGIYDHTAICVDTASKKFA